METSIDLYADEYAGDYDDENENQDDQVENENQDEQVENENQEEQVENEDNQETDNKETEEKRKVKPKRVIRNPRPKLDVNSLKSHKGLLCLEGYFKNKKYKGRGHEEEDLRTIMKTYEYWCHRLFPKFPFDECLSKIEMLGTKKNVQTYVNRIRMDLVVEEDKAIISDNEDEHITEPTTDQFDSLLPRQDVISEVPMLSEEQLERIRLNKEKANQLRLEKLQRANERIQASLPREPAADNAIHTENISRSNVENDAAIYNENGASKENISEAVILDDESRENTSPEVPSASGNKTDSIINDSEGVSMEAHCEEHQSCGNIQESTYNTESPTSIEERMEQ